MKIRETSQKSSFEFSLFIFYHVHGFLHFFCFNPLSCIKYEHKELLAIAQVFQVGKASCMNTNVTFNVIIILLIFNCQNCQIPD